MPRVEIKLVKSPISAKPNHRATVRCLGLRKLSQTVEREMTPQLAGMLHSVRHLVAVKEVSQ